MKNMDILNILKRLRDDLKAWVTANLNALNAKIDEKTIPIDNKLDSNSTNPVQNKVVADAINNIPRFSGDYNDLTNAPDISEDNSGAMVITDESGNIIFRADANGVQTTALTLTEGPAATEAYVDAAIAEIPTPNVSDQINAHNTNETAHEDIRQAIDTAKEELSESIVAEADEWKVVDEAGNIIFSVDASGAHTTELTLNGEKSATEYYVDSALEGYATEQWVEDKKYLTKHQDISGKSDIGHKHVMTDVTDLPANLATIDDVNQAIADFVEADPVALEALQELSQALENHEDAYDALLETVGSKATYTDLENLKSEITEEVVSEQQEFHVVDNSGNIVTSIDANGIATTTVTAQSVVINGSNVKTEIDTVGSNLSTHTANSKIHVTEADKTSWNKKVDSVNGQTGVVTIPVPTKVTDLEGHGDYLKSDAIADWAKQPNKPTYDKTDVGLGNVDNTSDANKPVSTATQTALDNLKDELSESIVSETNEWRVVDNNGNVIFSVDASGAHTTELTLSDGCVATETYVENAISKYGNPITNDEIDEICSTSMTTYLNSIASEGVSF